MLCHLGFLWKHHRFLKWVHCSPVLRCPLSLNECSVVLYLELCLTVSHISVVWNQAQVASECGHHLSHWHLHALPGPAFSCPSPRETLADGAAAGLWDAARGASLQSSGIHVQTCHCLDGLSKLGNSWEFSWEVSPSLHRLIPSHTSVENGLVYDTTSNEIELSFINWANVFSWLLPVVSYVQCYFPL